VQRFAIDLLSSALATLRLYQLSVALLTTRPCRVEFVPSELALMADPDRPFQVEPKVFDSAAPDHVMGTLGYFHAMVYNTSMWTRDRASHKCIGMYTGELNWQTDLGAQTDNMNIVSASGKGLNQYGAQSKVAKNIQAAARGKGLHNVSLAPLFPEFSVGAAGPGTAIRQLSPELQNELSVEILQRIRQLIALYPSTQFDDIHLYHSLKQTSLWTVYQAWYPEHHDSYYQQSIAFLVRTRSLSESAAHGSDADIRMQEHLGNLYEIMTGSADYDAVIAGAIEKVAICIQASNLVLSQYMYNNAAGFRCWPGAEKEEVGRICQDLMPSDDNIRQHTNPTPFTLVHGAMLGIDINSAVGDVFGQCAENNGSSFLHDHIMKRQKEGWKLVRARLDWYSTVKDLSHPSSVLHLPLCPVCQARFVEHEEAALQLAADKN